MKTNIQILVAVLLLSTISCKKESNNQNLRTAVQNNSTNDVQAVGTIVRIGTQKWSKENLNVTRYKNGDKIPHVENAGEWSSLTTGAWCWYKHDSAKDSVYGKLYNWYAVNDSRGLAPVGWHVPNDEEWETLTNFLGGINVAGGKMKATGTIQAGNGLWRKPNTSATNSSGFTALPAGSRNPAGTFQFIGETAYWWSSTEYITSATSVFYAIYYEGDLVNPFLNKKYGFSVRCIKD